MSIGTRLIDKVKFVTGFPPATPSSASPAWVNLKNYNHLTVVITCKNATTVTGSAVTLSQATDTSGTGTKALAFVKQWANLDTGASDTPVETAVASNTFTTDATNSKNLKYVIEVDAPTLDVANGFSCVQVGLGNATASVIAVEYILSGTRFGGNVATNPSAVV